MQVTFYHCPVCGNLMLMLLPSGVTPICCGQEMEVLEPNTAEASTEKHLPVVTSTNMGTRVTVGSAPHPMTEAHHIQFIVLVTTHGIHIRHLTATDVPEALFPMHCSVPASCSSPTPCCKPIAAYAYCNLHGLWRTDL